MAIESFDLKGLKTLKNINEQLPLTTVDGVKQPAVPCQYSVSTGMTSQCQ